MTAGGWLALIGVLVLLGVVVWLAWPRIAAAIRAHRDYRRARGTRHRREIERVLPRLDQRIAAERGMLVDAKRDLRDLVRTEEADLDRALAEHLVRTRLDDVRGVGESRIDAIRATVFRGQLRDLLRAEAVPGIGPQTAEAIAAWVARMEADWPKLRAGTFPGKSEIASRYASRRDAIERDSEAASRRLKELDDIGAAARSELAWLQRVTPGAFRRSLRSSGSGDSTALRAYVLGVFPPWETPPRWYAALIEMAADERKG